MRPPRGKFIGQRPCEECGKPVDVYTDAPKKRFCNGLCHDRNYQRKKRRKLAELRAKEKAEAFEENKDSKLDEDIEKGSIVDVLEVGGTVSNDQDSIAPVVDVGTSAMLPLRILVPTRTYGFSVDADEVDGEEVLIIEITRKDEIRR